MSSLASAHLGTKPRYVQLATTLMREIESGRYPIGALIPTEFELCDQFGVSRFTVREAVKLLVQQGLIVRQAGVGSRVQSAPVDVRYTQTMSGLADLQQYADETTLVVDSKNIVELTAKRAEQLKVSPKETWLHVEGLRFARDERLPICHTEVFIAPHLRSVAGIHARTKQPIYAILEKEFGVKITRVEQEISAVILSAKMINRLKTSARSPAIWICRRYFDERGDLIEQAHNTHPADRFTYREVFQRDHKVIGQ
jgi:GntR family transcriptional regulator